MYQIASGDSLLYHLHTIGNPEKAVNHLQRKKEKEKRVIKAEGKKRLDSLLARSHSLTHHIPQGFLIKP